MVAEFWTSSSWDEADLLDKVLQQSKYELIEELSEFYSIKMGASVQCATYTCAVETSGLQQTYTENGLFSEVGNSSHTALNFKESGFFNENIFNKVVQYIEYFLYVIKLEGFLI